MTPSQLQHIIYVLYLKITIAWSGLVPRHAIYAVQSQESHFCNLLQRAPSSVAKIIAQKSGIQEEEFSFSGLAARQQLAII